MPKLNNMASETVTILERHEEPMISNRDRQFMTRPVPIIASARSDQFESAEYNVKSPQKTMKVKLGSDMSLPSFQAQPKGRSIDRDSNDSVYLSKKKKLISEHMGTSLKSYIE